MRPSGHSSPLIALWLAVLCACTGCGVRYGMSQGGLPRNIHTVAVQPFENETASADLPRELLDGLRREFRSRFGLREAAPDRADALVRGVIRAYDVDIPIAVSANRTQSVSARRRLQITIDIEILDQTTGKTLWQQKGLRTEGDYAEGAEAEGRQKAVTDIVQAVLTGAQSQW